MTLGTTGFIKCVFDSCYFLHVDIGEVHFINCEFKNCHFGHIHFNSTHILVSQFESCVFRGGKVINIHTMDVRINNCKFIQSSREKMVAMPFNLIEIPDKTINEGTGTTKSLEELLFKDDWFKKK